MKESSISKIVGISHDIKHFEKSIDNIKGMDDPMCNLMRWQFQHSKEQLLKELMVELVNSGIEFSEIQSYLNSVTSYLSRNEGKGEKLPEIALINLQEVEKLMAVA
jgi:PP-loop superfamily ATP-utilizing enzyme